MNLVRILRIVRLWFRVKGAVPLVAWAVSAILALAACAPSQGRGSIVPTERFPTAITPRPLPSPRPAEGLGATATTAPVVKLEPGDQLIGNLDGSVVLVAYLDFQCRYCAGVAGSLRQVQELHPNEVALLYRAFPQPDLHDKATLAAVAAEVASLSGEFWGMFDLLFQNQEEWMGLSPNSFRGWTVQAAGQLLLDRQHFESSLDDPEIRSRIDASARRAQANGLPGAPMIFVNGRIFQPPPSARNLEAAVRLELLAPRQYASYPSSRIDPTDSYQALLVFDRGEMLVELFPQTAPAAVNSFVFLSEENWYDGAPVHRVLPGILFETGDPSGTGLGGPGYSFPSEIDPGLVFDRAGRVAMVSVGPGTNGSQFLITLAPEPGLDGSRTIFGQVLTGLEPFLTLPGRDPLADLLEPPSASLQAVHILLP